METKDIILQLRTKKGFSQEELAEKEGITEQLKAADQMAWVQRMSNIRNRAEEIVSVEMIFA